jgi:hypothetical protein
MSEPMAVPNLLADPARFDGQVVTVAGWFVWGREHSALYPSPVASSRPVSGVWVVHAATVGGVRSVAELNRGWVRAVGVFGNRRQAGCGHFGAWPAQLSGLSELCRIKPPAEQEVAPDCGGNT